MGRPVELAGNTGGNDAVAIISLHATDIVQFPPANWLILPLPFAPMPPMPCPPAAVATGIACGVPLKAVVAGIEAVDIIPGRCEIVDEGQQFSVVVSWLDLYTSLIWIQSGLVG